MCNSSHTSPKLHKKNLTTVVLRGKTLVSCRNADVLCFIKPKHGIRESKPSIGHNPGNF